MIDAPQQRAIKIIALTDQGLQLAEKLDSVLSNSELLFKPQPFAEKVQQAFVAGGALVFICATGIVMRTLAPVIKDKHNDPPVLVMDELGQFVIPLLSGHEGGANEWAAQLANELEAKCVLTTANAYLKPVYTVGMGCERDCPKEYLSELLNACLEQAGLKIEQIESFHSIDIKHDERALIELAAGCSKPYQTWAVKELAKMEHLLSVRSEYVFETVGVYGVAESAALYGAYDLSTKEPELVLAKQKNAKATCAIARVYCS